MQMRRRSLYSEGRRVLCRPREGRKQPEARDARATPLPGNLDAAFDAFRQFEADYQRKLAGVALASEFVTNKPAPNGRVTIADSIEKYLLKCKSAGLRRTTIAAYSGALEDFKSSTDKTYVDELEKEDITGVYCSWMRSNVRKNVGNKDGQRNITFNKRMGFVNTWTETFSDHGLLGKDWEAACSEEDSGQVRRGHDRSTAEGGDAGRKHSDSVLPVHRVSRHGGSYRRV